MLKMLKNREIKGTLDKYEYQELIDSCYPFLKETHADKYQNSPCALFSAVLAERRSDCIKHEISGEQWDDIKRGTLDFISNFSSLEKQRSLYFLTLDKLVGTPNLSPNTINMITTLPKGIIDEWCSAPFDPTNLSIAEKIRHAKRPFKIKELAFFAVQIGNLTVIQYLLDNNIISYNSTTEIPRPRSSPIVKNLFEEAARTGHVLMVQSMYLGSDGTVPNLKVLHTAFITAVKAGQNKVIKFLLDSHKLSDDTVREALHISLIDKNREVIQTLLLGGGEYFNSLYIEDLVIESMDFLASQKPSNDATIQLNLNELHQSILQKRTLEKKGSNSRKRMRM